MKLFLTAMTVLVMFAAPVFSQPSPEAKTSTQKVGIALDELIEELDLNKEQQLNIALVLLKYSPEVARIKMSGDGKPSYAEIRKLLKAFEKDLKTILTRQQFKVYKRKKRAIRKELMHS